MAEMKALVLCAGEGTRLRPLTFSRPKHLLPVAGRSLLARSLDTIRATGIRKVGIVIGHQAQSVRHHVGDGSAWDMQVEYIEQQQPLGLAHAVKCAQDFIGDSPFLLYLGDNLLENGICDFVERFRREQPAAAMILRKVDDPQRYGVAELNEDTTIQRLVEKPVMPKTNLAVVGVYAFGNGIFSAIDSINPSARGEYEITDAIQALIDGGATVTSARLTGFWEDAGQPEALLRANRLYLNMIEDARESTANGASHVTGTIEMDGGSRIKSSRILGPCHIGENCVIEDSTIGPYVSLGSGCEIRNSAIEDAIVQSGSLVTNVTSGLKGSVLGEQVVVVGSGFTDHPMTLLLGDMAQIRVI